MKQTSLPFTRTLLTICLVGIIVLSCKKDEPFYQVDAFEMEIHHNVNKYRRSQGLSDLVFFHDLFVEARQQSTAWKNSGNPSEGMQARVDKIYEHWKPVNFDVLLSTINGKDTTAARIVVEYWIQDSAMSAVLRDDFIQSGPGIAQGDDGIVYITHFFMKIHD
jgi:predicted SnoaL-like aldol condensation-catalyzing enzyme